MKSISTSTLILFLFLSTSSILAQLSLNPCIENTDFKIVVLGSSTAAGSGPSTSDSAWVNRYRNTLKAINPNNQVINLAVGGYTTYRIMPDNFVTPSGRPAVDTNHNITKALSLNPDAIIVNLPSNDRGWPMNEQLSNFDSLYNHSWNNGVPMYICTTQPITTAGTYQKSVRDSIISMFSPYYIEFFTPLADTNNLVVSAYAADAVHLNDHGHLILFQQVWQRNILADIYTPSLIPDMAIRECILPTSKCSDTTATIGWTIVNLGDSSQIGGIGLARISNGTMKDSTGLSLSAAIAPCSIDTIWTTFNISASGVYSVSASLSTPQDTNTSNDSLTVSFETVSKPEVLFSKADTLCLGTSTNFGANLISGDTILFYTTPQDTVPVNTSSSFSINKDTTMYIQAVTGDLTFSGGLTSSTSNSINWNGNMFDLVADQDITLESIEIRANGIGSFPVNVYTKAGTYQGHVTNASSWTSLTVDTLVNSIDSEFQEIKIPAISLSQGDTIGIYIHMAQSGQSLWYQSSTQPVSISTGELTYLSGSGVSYQFAGEYANRVINAKFSYSYGFNRFGECATPLMPISRILAPISLGLTDTIFTSNGGNLSVSIDFTNVVWIQNADTIQTGNTLSIDTNRIPLGSSINVVCIGLNKWGCQSSDTISITLANDVGLDELENGFSIYPNPASEKLTIQASKGTIINEVLLNSINGVLIFRKTVDTNTLKIDVSSLPEGIYVLECNGVKRKLRIK